MNFHASLYMKCGEGFYYDRVGVDQQPRQGLLHEYKNIINIIEPK